MLLFSIILLLSSESGSRWLVTTALQASGQNIELRGVEGRLINELRIEKLIYRSASRNDSQIVVQLETLRMEWDASALLRRKIRIPVLSLDSLDITLPAPSDAPVELAVPALGAGWAIHLDRLDIASLAVHAQQSLTKFEKISLSAAYQGNRLSISDALLQVQTLGISLSGNVELENPFSFDADLGLSTSGLSESVWQVQSRLNIRGVPDRYVLKGQASISTSDLPTLTGRFSGSGSLKELRLSDVQADALSGALQGSGLLNWENALRLEFDIRGRDILTADLKPDLPGKLNFSGQFSMLDQSLSLDLSADGRLRGYPLDAKLRARGNARMWLVEEGQINSGPNQLRFDGGVGRDGLEGFKLRLDAPELATLYPNLAGKLSANGALNGAWAELRGQAQLKAEALSYQTLVLRTLTVGLNPANPSDVDSYRLQIKANDLSYAGLRLPEVEIKALGLMQRQRIDILIREQSGGRFISRLDAKYENQQWRAEISNSVLDVGPWRGLKQTGKAWLQLGKQKQRPSITLSNYCLKGKVESICGEMQFASQNLDAKIELKQIPLQALSKASDVQTLPPMLLKGKLDLQGSDQRWDLNAQVQVDSHNTVSLKAGMNRKTGKLDGQLRADLTELKNLSILSEQLSHTSGHLSADLVLSGSNEKPDISGQIKLRDASSKLPGTGINLEAIEATLALLDFQHAEIQGSLKSGPGSLTVSGHAQWWPPEEQALELQIKGQNFLLIDLPDIYAEVSPGLTVSANPENILLDGEIRIPNLSVMLEDLSSQAITISEDARIVGVAQPESSKPPRLPVTARIRLLLGENVSMSGMGLAVKLAGELEIKESPGKPLRANGEIDVREGRYTAYGQNLSLLESSLIFNGPVSEPGLNLKAQREIKAKGAGRDVTVGVLVGGTLQSPVSELFSNPSMSDSDAVAYLLTGAPLSSADDGEGTIMISALTQLGVKGSSGLVEKIQNSTGLSTFEIDAGDDVSETALKLGKYLTPQLYVQYVKRVFTDTQSIQARYDINDRVYIETESGDKRSIDLKFQIER